MSHAFPIELFIWVGGAGTVGASTALSLALTTASVLERGESCEALAWGEGGGEGT